jgi:hypothetical protein
MKILPLPKARTVSKKELGCDKRESFFAGQRLNSVIKALQERCKELHVPPPSKSLVFREGGFLFCRKMNADLNKAQKGVLHAKKRVIKFGLSR